MWRFTKNNGITEGFYTKMALRPGFCFALLTTVTHVVRSGSEQVLILSEISGEIKAASHLYHFFKMALRPGFEPGTY